MNCPQLKLENQLCFPLYAVSKEITRRYTPFLEPLGLTYTQYIAMLVLWEEKKCNVTELGKKLFLDSGTLTPLLKKMAEKNLVARERSESDERSVIISLTSKGKALEKKCRDNPDKLICAAKLEQVDGDALMKNLHKMLSNFRDAAD